MHDDRELIERRIERELWERVLPLVHRDRRALTVFAGPDPDRLDTFAIGTPWGPPWTTTWFRLDGEVPVDWIERSGTRVEALIDLGFTRDPPGFQCEGLVVGLNSADDPGSFVPLQGIHPRRTNYQLPATAGPVSVMVEAASNPAFPQFVPTTDGSWTTADTEPRYRFRRAELVLVDVDIEALVHDLDVLDGVMRALPMTDPSRARLLATISGALDVLPDTDAARRKLAPELVARGPSNDAAAPRRHRIVATGHAHIDTAWLWPIRETKRKCARTFASAVALMDEYPDFKFSVSQAQQYAWIEEQHPKLFAAITERVKQGQWLPVGGMWVEADMNLPSAESIARQIVFGQKYFIEKFGAPCKEVWIPDVFGYPAGLPQLFAAGGMHRFITQKLSWNKQNRFPHHTFWWEGLDGTRVLTHFPPVDTYNAELTPSDVSSSLENFREHSWSTASLMPFGYGDGGGGPTREMMQRANRLAEINPLATLEIGSTSDFFEHVEREATYGAPVPVWRGELYFETHRGTLTSQLKTKTGNRRCERLLVESELWAATLVASGRQDAVAAVCTVMEGHNDLWCEVLTQQFHDILPGSSIAWVHSDAEEVFERIGAELERRISVLLAELTPTDVAEAWLANPADTAVSGVVVLPRELSGEAVGSDKQELADGTTAVGLGAEPLSFAPLKPKVIDDRVVLSDTSMTNGQLSVRWDRAGNITSIIDIVRTREIVPAGSHAAVLELAKDHPVEYDAWDLESWTRQLGKPVAHETDRAPEVTIDDCGPLVGRVTVKRWFGPSSAIVTYELRASEPQLYLHVDLDWNHDEHLLSMAFPIDIRTGDAMCDVQLGVVARPTHPSSPWDAAKFEVCAHRFVDLAEPDFGVAVLNNGRYGHSVFNGAIRVSLARAANYPHPAADRGRHSVTLAVRPHGPGLVDVRAAASRLNSPARVVPTSAPSSATAAASSSGDQDSGGDHSDRRPVLEVTGDGVEVDAVKLADDASGDIIVRLHEACGNRVHVSVRACRRIGAAWHCDLLESKTAGEEVTDGIVALTLRPFQLVTLRLDLTADFDGR